MNIYHDPQTMFLDSSDELVYTPSSESPGWLQPPKHVVCPSTLTNANKSSDQPLTGPSVPVPHQTSASSHTRSGIRKLLTDGERRLILQFREDNPKVKQEEIAKEFKVHRSTVSKIVRQTQPVKRNKGKLPDIEKALANWAKKQTESGLPPTDHDIKKKAEGIIAALNTGERPVEIKWLQECKENIGIESGADALSTTLPPGPESSTLPSSTNDERKHRRIATTAGSVRGPASLQNRPSLSELVIYPANPNVDSFTSTGYTHNSGSGSSFTTGRVDSFVEPPPMAPTLKDARKAAGILVFFMTNVSPKLVDEDECEAVIGVAQKLWTLRCCIGSLNFPFSAS